MIFIAISGFSVLKTGAQVLSPRIFSGRLPQEQGPAGSKGQEREKARAGRINSLLAKLTTALATAGAAQRFIRV